MSQQSHDTSAFREPAGSGSVPSVAPLRLKQFSPGVWGFAAGGAPDAVIVEASPGVYTIVDPTVAADAALVRIGTSGAMY